MYDDQLYGQLAVATGMISADQLQQAVAECQSIPPEMRPSLRLMLIRGGWISAEDDALLQQRTAQMQAAPTLDVPPNAPHAAYEQPAAVHAHAPLDTPGEVRKSGPQSNDQTFDALGATSPGWQQHPPPTQATTQQAGHPAAVAHAQTPVAPAAQARQPQPVHPQAEPRPDGLHDTQQHTVFTVEGAADPVHREVDPDADPRSTSMPVLTTGEFPMSQLRMPKYAHQRLLGRGGMGEVALAVDRDLRREVAVKTLLRPDDSAVRAQFIEEAQVTGQLEHPNIVPIHELGMDDNERPYLVMKRVKGRSLHEILQGMAEGRGSGLHDINRSPSSTPSAPASQTGRASESGRYSRTATDSIARRGRLHRMRETTTAQATKPRDIDDDSQTPAAQLAKLLPVFLKICDALAYAHARNVVHRDLKPENIMIGEFGEVLVMDWGLAKVLGKRAGSGAVAIDEMISTSRQDGTGGDAQHTVDGTIKGTPAYMAPEQAMGDVGKIDQRTDVYALGALLYEMLTLKPPYEGRSVLSVLAAVAKNELVPPSERAPGRVIPRELESVVLKAMQKSPAKRYQTVLKLKADIEAYMAGRALAAATYSPLQLLGKWAKRNRLKVAMLAIVVVLLGAGVFGMVKAAEFAREQEKLAKEAEIDAKVDEMAAELDAVKEDLAGIETAIASTQFESAIENCDGFMDKHAEVLERLTTSDTLRERRVEVYDEAVAMPDAVTRVRVDAIRAWCDHTLDTIVVEPEIATDARRIAARDAFARFKPYLEEPRLADVRVADFAVWLASVGFAARDEVEGSKWVAEAYIVQPDSEATGRGFLMLADYSLNHLHRPEKAAIQYEMALSQYGDDHPRLRPRALLGLTNALANMAFRPAPMDTSLSARTVALRCVLKLITPQGELRNDIKAVLDNDADAARIQQEARNHLVALRRSTFGVEARVNQAVDYDGDGEVDSWLAHAEGLRYEFVRPQRPNEVGEALPTLEPFAEFDLRAIVDRLAADVNERAQLTGGITVDRFFDDDSDLQVGFCLRPRLDNAQDCVFAIAELNSPVPIFAMRVPHRPRRLLVADLDGDGLKDIVFTYGLDWRGAWVAFGEPNRRFSQLVQLTDRVGGAGSMVDDIAFTDLNDDGVPELLLHLSAWNDFSLEVIDVRPNRTFARRAFLRVGRTPVRTIRVGGETFIAIASGISEAHERFFEIVNEPVPPLGMQLLRYNGQSLERIPLIRTAFRPDDAATFQGRFNDEYGREALVLFGALEGTARGMSIYFFDSFNRLDAVPLGVVQHATMGLSTERDGWTNAGGRFCHYLTDRDLDVIAEVPLPRADPVERSASVELARFMLDAGLVRESAGYATAARITAPTAEIANELLRIELQARLSLRQYSEVQRVLDGLAPSGSLLPDVLMAAELVATELRQYGFARRLFNDWSSSSALTVMQRNELTTRARVWRQLATDLGAPIVEWRGEDVYLRGEEQGVIGEYLMTTDLDIIDLDPEGGAFTTRGQDKRSRLHVGPDANLNMTAAVRRYEAACGIPLRFDGGSFRLVIDARVVSIPWNARMRLGLFPIDAMFNPGGASALRQGVSFWTTGGNEIYRLGVNAESGSGAAIDEKIGAWMRYDIEYIAHQRTLSFAIHDLEARKSVSYEVRDTSNDPLRGGNYLLGLGGEFADFPAEVQVKRFALFGACDLISPDANEMRALELFRPDISAYSIAARGWLNARYAEAENALRNYADVVELALGAAGGDPLALFPNEPQRLRILAAWYGSGGDADTFAEKLEPLLNNQRDLQFMLETIMSRPGSTIPDDLLAGAGKAAARVSMPGSSPRAALTELDRRLRSGQEFQEVDFLIAAWVFEELPNDPQARAVAVFSMAILLDGPARQGMNGLPPHALSMLNHFLTVVETTALSASEQDQVRFVRGMALTYVMRRRDALRVMESGSGTAAFGTAYERHRRIADRRREELANKTAQARERGVPFAAMPDED